MGVPLRICSVCDGALYAFSKFKQLYLESSRRLEASLRDSGAPIPPAEAPVDTSTPEATPGKIEEIYVKEEPVEETWMDSEMQTDIPSPEVELRTGKGFIDPSVHFPKDNKDSQMEFYNNIIPSTSIIDGSNETLTSETYLKSYIKTHAPVPIKEGLSCTICNKLNFRYKSDLDQHMKIHSDIKDYKCDICSKPFTRKGHLITHMRIHSGIKDFQCETCNKLFTEKSNLVKHMKIHSGIKDFQCDICSKPFTQKGHLLTHMKIHAGIKDFQCDVCTKSFTEKSILVKHLRIHSGIKDFQCEMCKKSFGERYKLLRHMKVHPEVKDNQNHSDNSQEAVPSKI